MLLSEAGTVVVTTEHARRPRTLAAPGLGYHYMASWLEQRKDDGVPLRQLKRIRWAVRATLALGVIASTIANILHAEPNVISQTIAAWPPLALLLTIELISRVPVHHPALAAVRLVATVIIAGIAAWVSYWHMVGVISRYGETGASPYLIPLTVDGLVVVASVCLVELGGRIQAATAPDPVTTGASAQTPAGPAIPLATDTQPIPEPSDPRTVHDEDQQKSQPETRGRTHNAERTARRSHAPTPLRPRRPTPTDQTDEPSSDKREVKVPQTAEACTRWIACWISMCRDGLDTGPISLSFEAEAKQRYGWGVKQIRDVRNAATTGHLRRQANLLGVTLPAEYADNSEGVSTPSPASDVLMVR